MIFINKYIIITKKYSSYYYDSLSNSMSNTNKYQGLCIYEDDKHIKILEPYYPLHYKNKINIYRKITIKSNNIKNIKKHDIHLIEDKYNIPNEIFLKILGYIIDIESYKNKNLFNIE